MSRENSTFARLILPASIFDRSRMSLMTCSRWRAASSTLRRRSRCQLVARFARHEVGQAHDRVHGRADLVAHVGEERALRPACRFGGILRDGQRRGAVGDELFQVLAVRAELLFHAHPLDLGASDADAQSEVAARLGQRFDDSGSNTSASAAQIVRTPRTVSSRRIGRVSVAAQPRPRTSSRQTTSSPLILGVFPDDGGVFAQARPRAPTPSSTDPRSASSR